MGADLILTLIFHFKMLQVLARILFFLGFMEMTWRRKTGPSSAEGKYIYHVVLYVIYISPLRYLSRKTYDQSHVHAFYLRPMMK